MTTLTRTMLSALLVTLTAGAVAAQGIDQSGKGTKELFPGAKLIHRFSDEVYLEPFLVETKVGPRLVVSIHSAMPTFPSLGDLQAGKFKKAPDLEVVLWDLAANKEIHRFSSKKKQWLPQGFPDYRLLQFTNDGKKIVHLAWTEDAEISISQIKLYDLATRKSVLLPARYSGGVQVHFAPDGAMVILGAQGGGDAPIKFFYCVVQELGKAKPRHFFRLVQPKSRPGPFGLENSGGLHATALSPDGSKLAVSIGGTISVYEIKTGKVVFQAPRAFWDDPYHLAGWLTSSLTFSPRKDDQKLIVIDQGCAKKKDFVLTRVFNLKTKKAVASTMVYEKPAKIHPKFLWPSSGTPFFNAKSEPRVLFQGKIHDVIKGKVLREFDQGMGALMSRDGHYLVRLTRSATDKARKGVEIWSVDAE